MVRLLHVISSCIDDVCQWFLANGLLLYPAKTEAILFGTPSPAWENFSFGQSRRCWVGGAISWTCQAASCYAQCDLDHRSPRPRGQPQLYIPHMGTIVTLCYIGQKPEETAGCSERTGEGSLPCSSTATELWRHLHWLPVHQRIYYKLALLTYKTRSTGTPAYLASLLESHKPARTLQIITYSLYLNCR